MFLGLRAMLTTIVAQIVAAILLGIFLTLNPYALIVAALVGGGAAAQIANIFQLKKKIKDTVVEKLAAGFDTNRRELADSVREKVEEHLMVLRTNLDESLVGELSSVRGEVENIIKEQCEGKANAARKTEELSALQQANAVIDEKLDALMYEAGLGMPA
jgi:hypothetical protein